MQIYKLYIAKPLLAFYLIMIAAWSLGGILLVGFGAIGMFGPDGPPTLAFVPMAFVGLFVAYMWLRTPFEIRIRDDEMIEFRSVLRKTIVPPLTIRSVRAKRYSLGLVDVAHDIGTIHLVNQMDGFHDFIARLKELNPAVEIAGC